MQQIIIGIFEVITSSVGVPLMLVERKQSLVLLIPPPKRGGGVATPTRCFSTIARMDSVAQRAKIADTCLV